MDFAHDATTVDLIDRMQAFLDEYVYPAEPELAAELAERPDSWSTPEVIRRLQVVARERRL